MKSRNKHLKVYYDKEADVLYVSHGKPSSLDDTSETEDEVVVRKDPKTGQVKGFTILHFLKRGMNKTAQVKLPFEIEFNQASA